MLAKIVLNNVDIVRTLVTFSVLFKVLSEPCKHDPLSTYLYLYKDENYMNIDRLLHK